MATQLLPPVNPAARRRTKPAPLAPAQRHYLLERFAARRSEGAFAALVERHGPMVLSVCRRVLGDAHDAEDAFQATFLVLARKADRPETPVLGDWLYKVAYRIACAPRRHRPPPHPGKWPSGLPRRPPASLRSATRRAGR